MLSIDKPVHTCLCLSVYFNKYFDKNRLLTLDSNAPIMYNLFDKMSI